eukprot:gene14114-20066_t
MGAGFSQGISGQAPSSANERPDLTLEMQVSVSIEVEDIINAAKAAGDAIMEIYEGESSKWEVQMKGDNSPLTKADKMANQVIVEALSRRTPHIPIISEENPLLPHEARQVDE